jgi:heme oxygenase
LLQTTALSSPARAAADAVPDALTALRQATGRLHAQLDAGLALARPGASLADYGRHLANVLGWLETLQPSLDRVGFGADEAVARQGRLQADLADIAQMAGRAPACSEMPRAAGAEAPLPAASTHRAWCWGAAYVVEGSALGGLVLHRRLRDALHPHPLRYLAGGAEPAAAHWGRFVAALREALTAPADIALACEGAVWAFESFAHRAGAGVPVRREVAA